MFILLINLVHCCYSVFLFFRTPWAFQWESLRPFPEHCKLQIGQFFVNTFFLSIITNAFFFFEYSYVGNLDPSVTEELIMVLFGQIGTVKGCKIIHEVKSVQTWDPNQSFPTFSQSDLHLVMSGRLKQALWDCKHTRFSYYRPQSRWSGKEEFGHQLRGYRGCNITSIRKTGAYTHSPWLFCFFSHSSRNLTGVFKSKKIQLN
jgi:hypothetical protein